MREQEGEREIEKESEREEERDMVSAKRDKESESKGNVRVSQREIATDKWQRVAKES